jgi:hypothetical protein
VPRGVPAAAVAQAGDVTDEDLIRSKGVPVWASIWGFGHPLAASGSYQLALVHSYRLLPPTDRDRYGRGFDPARGLNRQDLRVAMADQRCSLKQRALRGF